MTMHRACCQRRSLSALLSYQKTFLSYVLGIEPSSIDTAVEHAYYQRRVLVNRVCLGRIAQ